MRYEPVYTYKRKKFLNIFETKLCDCFGQLLFVSLKNVELGVEHGIEHDIDSAYGVCIHWTFLNFTVDLMNTLQFKQMMNLKAC